MPIRIVVYGVSGIYSSHSFNLRSFLWLRLWASVEDSLTVYLCLWEAALICSSQDVSTFLLTKAGIIMLSSPAFTSRVFMETWWHVSALDSYYTLCHCLHCFVYSGCFSVHGVSAPSVDVTAQFLQFTVIMVPTFRGREHVPGSHYYWPPQCGWALAGGLLANESSWWVISFSSFISLMGISVLHLSRFLAFTRLHRGSV